MNLERRDWVRLMLGAAAATATGGGRATLMGAAAGQAGVGGHPIDPGHLTQVAFGTYSHWLQPWRGYLETIPAHQFLNGLGIVLNTHRGEDVNQILQMCARHGIKHVRIEIGWGNLDYRDEAKIKNSKDLAIRLQASRAHGLRPLILLNGHHGAPCPLLNFERSLAADVPAGARKVVLDSVADLVIGKSGFSHPRRSIAAEYLITAVEGATVTLSKPLPDALPAGTKLKMATLKYQPFGDPGTDEGKSTLQGWRQYVQTVASFVTEVLGTAGAADRGFDMEIWNELSFGSNFIHQSRYFDPIPQPYEEKKVFLDVVRATAEVAMAQAEPFVGVRLVNGFSNTLPWPASSEMPARVMALSHHPYAGRKVFPRDQPKGAALNAQGIKDESGFEPLYEASFPEYFASALQTETITRDMAPLTTRIYNTAHGRYARPEVDGPCWCWITEVNYAPGEDGINDPAHALKLKAKAIARYFCFYLNKGVERLYLYAAGANDPALGDLELGVLKQEFVTRSITDKAYPTAEQELALVSPALQVVQRIVSRFNAGGVVDAALTVAGARKLELVSVEDSHGAMQFDGDPNDMIGRPPLYNRDVVAFLPYQVHATRFVVPCYVMTRDIRQELGPQGYVLTVKGWQADGLKVSGYDPVLDEPVPVKVTPREGGVGIEVALRDYPVLLEVEER
ncbi:hypothetical protein [Verrucomicrobium sp. BvORR106]|uniref:hypothetical protein n=1 Tax=Verrucomicrobium sp. BvORR106 TaxID=1403819 RepID=UPI00056DF19E|nr:hypothetical protein [Verrucomicrobium sp. BvORR106]